MTVDAPARWARACWAAGEPYTLVPLFTPEAAAVATGVGLPGQASYVLLRTAPMGAAHPAVVVSALHSLPTAAVSGLLRAARSVIDPQDAVTASHEVATAVARRQHADLFADPRVGEIADLLTGVVGGLDTSGRPLAAANQAVEPPDEPWARLWRAANTLREYRGDGHVAVLTAEALDVDEAEVLMVAWAGPRMDAELLRTSRGIDDSRWSSAQARLALRGVLDERGALTPQGRALREHIEDATDAASATPWRRLGADDTVRVWTMLRELSEHVLASGEMRAVTPVGAPWPPPDVP